MDVRCGLCGTEYDFDDALISERGTTVQCTECGFQFKVYPEQPLSGVERWLVRSGSGAGWEREYTTLKELQQAIRQGDIGPADLLSRGSAEPRPLASIAELEPLFRQRLVRSGGTLLGMMPVPGAGSGSDAGPPSAAPFVPGGRRVATKLGLPAPPLPDSIRPESSAFPVPPSGPPPVEPRSSAPAAELTETSPSSPHSDTSLFNKTLPSATPPPELERLDRVSSRRREEHAPEPEPPVSAPTSSELASDDRSAFLRTLPSAITPHPLATHPALTHPTAPSSTVPSSTAPGSTASGPTAPHSGAATEEERGQAHPSPPRQRIVSLLSASADDEPAPSVDSSDRAWALQTLPSVPGGVERPSPEQLTTEGPSSRAGAAGGPEEPPGGPSASVPPSSIASVVSSVPPSSIASVVSSVPPGSSAPPSSRASGSSVPPGSSAP